MPTLSQAESDSIDKLMQSAAGPITYRRGDHSVDLDAIVSQRRTEVAGGTRVAVTSDAFDVLLKPEELILNSLTVKPKANDKIESGSKVYVVSPGEDQQIWRPSGPDELLIRIHAIRQS